MYIIYQRELLLILGFIVICIVLIRKKFFEHIFQDNNRYFKKNVFNIIRFFLLSPGYRTVVLYRISSFFANNCILVLPEIFYNLNTIVSGNEINPWCEIKSGLKIAHSPGIIIGNGVKIGYNCTIFQNTTLGAKSLSYNEMYKNEINRYPHLGNDIVIYANSMIVGPITVGNNVTIAAYSFVVEDVPDNVMIGGIPSKIIKHI